MVMIEGLGVIRIFITVRTVVVILIMVMITVK